MDSFHPIFRVYQSYRLLLYAFWPVTCQRARTGCPPLGPQLTAHAQSTSAHRSFCLQVINASRLSILLLNYRFLIGGLELFKVTRLIQDLKIRATILLPLLSFMSTFKALELGKAHQLIFSYFLRKC